MQVDEPKDILNKIKDFGGKKIFNINENNGAAVIVFDDGSRIFIEGQERIDFVKKVLKDPSEYEKISSDTAPSPKKIMHTSATKMAAEIGQPDNPPNETQGDDKGVVEVDTSPESQLQTVTQTPSSSDSSKTDRSGTTTEQISSEKIKEPVEKQPEKATVEPDAGGPTTREKFSKLFLRQDYLRVEYSDGKKVTITSKDIIILHPNGEREERPLTDQSGFQLEFITNIINSLDFSNMKAESQESQGETSKYISNDGSSLIVVRGEEFIKIIEHRITA